MPITLTSREFNQDTARAKREAAAGPVFVTDRGRTTHVLLTAEAYDRLTGPKKTILDMLAMAGMEDIDIDFDDFRDRSIDRPFEFDAEE
jgi:PHD/YefM family antitoxin component YafN of YafNO toxin-antitoxin module